MECGRTCFIFLITFAIGRASYKFAIALTNILGAEGHEEYCFHLPASIACTNVTHTLSYLLDDLTLLCLPFSRPWFDFDTSCMKHQSYKKNSCDTLKHTSLMFCMLFACPVHFRVVQRRQKTFSSFWNHTCYHTGRSGSTVIWPCPKWMLRVSLGLLC